MIKVCIIIPCYNVRGKISNVLKDIDKKIISKIIVVDDGCPEKTGIYVKKRKHKKVKVIFKKKNSGVGGATITGFKYALKHNFDAVIKLDGDHQHNPNDIKKFINLLKKNNINFIKGTRFDRYSNIKKIPFLRLFGNIALTLLTKINCRNFSITDALNGFLAIKVKLLKKIKFEKISKDFFFEEDLLFHISLLNEKVYEIPIKTVYTGKSNLVPVKIIIPFILKHISNFFYRLKYDFLK